MPTMRRHIKKSHPYKNIMRQVKEEIRDDVQVANYMGFWRRELIRMEAEKMRELRNKMRAGIGLPPL